jgi:hypothetical protein
MFPERSKPSSIRVDAKLYMNVRAIAAHLFALIERRWNEVQRASRDLLTQKDYRASSKVTHAKRYRLAKFTGMIHLVRIRVNELIGNVAGNKGHFIITSGGLVSVRLEYHNLNSESFGGTIVEGRDMGNSRRKSGGIRYESFTESPILKL